MRLFDLNYFIINPQGGNLYTIYDIFRANFTKKQHKSSPYTIFQVKQYFC